ncbi:hypothetical protein QFC22_005012 [Naganishia vaughanmartiniae]|uniref:Uncharacterized protein n=1 Tax=Naganishia vaughanmartiniae TaxID=1424756 RepID=A0ACC2WVS2_9TREE|nr:hypothetical protein QFC22_005012 [Naganishia vaughanmartiniae]
MSSANMSIRDAQGKGIIDIDSDPSPSPAAVDGPTTKRVKPAATPVIDIASDDDDDMNTNSNGNGNFNINGQSESAVVQASVQGLIGGWNGPIPVSVFRSPRNASTQQGFQQRQAFQQQAPPAMSAFTGTAGLPNPFDSHPVSVDAKPTSTHLGMNSGAQQEPQHAGPSQQQQNASTASTAIDLTNEASPPPSTAPPPSSYTHAAGHDPKKPICVGSIDTQALILYPTRLMSKGADTEELVRTRQVRVDLAGDEWLHVKCKYRRTAVPPGAPEGSQDGEMVVVMNMGQTVQLGLLNEGTFRVLSPYMAKSLIRVEGYIKRGDTDRMFTASLNLLLFTLPANIEYLSRHLAESSTFLDIPLPYYDPKNHADMPVYVNPHNPPEMGFRARNRRADTLLGRTGAYNGASFGGGMTQQKAIEVQRQQVDEVFRSLKGHDELAETEVPRERIKTKLFPHQRKAITFLLQREAESSAVKAAVKAVVARSEEGTPVSRDGTPTTATTTTTANDSDSSDSDDSDDSDAVSAGDRKRRAAKAAQKAAAKQLAKKQKEAEKEARRRGFNSLWEPMEEEKSRKGGVVGGKTKVRRWKNRVTEQIAEGKHRPEEARGSILADDMGLGKTLTTVALVACTLSSARKYARQCPTDYDASSNEDGAANGDGDSDEKSDLDASHFAGAVHGMPSTVASVAAGSNGATTTGADKKRKLVGDQQVKFDNRKIARMERRARLERIQLRSRGTLLICPLSTVTNWEDQIREHWNGNVYVQGGHQTVSQKRASNNGGDEDGDYTGKGKPDLRVFIYHGASRKVTVTKLADFDIVITTFNVLQTEYSKQLKTAQGISRYSSAGAAGASSSNAGTPSARDSDDPMEVDDDGTPARADEKPEVAADRKRLLTGAGAGGRGGKAKSNMVHGFDVMGRKTSREVVSPLQSIEWFRVVLDEAHFIKDPSTIVSRAASYLEAERRLCLTGTPIQNKVEDVWALLKFLRLKPFDDRNVWQTYIMSLAKAGNSLGVVRLQTILRHCTLRRTKDTVSKDGQRLLDLPPRVDRKVEIELSPEERAIYDAHFTQTKTNFEAMRSKKTGITYVNILQQILRLRQICDHWTLINEANVEDVEEEIMDEMDLDTAKQTILQEGLSLRRAFAYVNSLPDAASTSDAAEASSCYSCQVPLRVNESKEEEDEDEEVNNKGKAKKGKAKTRTVAPILTRCCHLFCQACFKREVFPSFPNQMVGAGRKCPACDTGLRLGTDVIEVAPGATLAVDAAANSKMKANKRKKFVGEPQLSSKMRVLLMDLLQISKHNPHSDNYDPSQASDIVDLDPDGKPLITKSVVFSQWTSMLDHIENMLSYADIGYARLDGTMKREVRAEAMDALKNDPKCEVLLVSLRAGGVGLNLTTASRAYLIDPYWNPSVENQAIDRIHRLGQTRSVTSIKYVVKNSIEEKMLQVQQRKSELVKISLNQSVSKKDLHERRLEDLKLLFS